MALIRGDWSQHAVCNTEILTETLGWMTCVFTSFFISISVISGQLADDDERLCAMEPR